MRCVHCLYSIAHEIRQHLLDHDPIDHDGGQLRRQHDSYLHPVLLRIQLLKVHDPLYYGDH